MNQSTDQPKHISGLHDPRRIPLKENVQAIQDRLSEIYFQFSGSTLAFDAGRLAWEAVRLLWYAIEDETDGDHLGDVRQALRVVEEHVSPPKKRTPEEIQQRIDDNFFDEEYD